MSATLPERVGRRSRRRRYPDDREARTTVAPVAEPAGSAGEWIDGDAAEHLDALVVEELPKPVAIPPADPAPTAEVDAESGAGFMAAAGVARGASVEIELVGPHLRLQGTLSIGQFRRLSDFLNHREGLIELRDATILRRNGTPTRVTTPSIWISPDEVTLIGQQIDPAGEVPQSELHVEKIGTTLIVVTPGHTMTGDVYIMREAQLAAFVESPDPQFVPMTDVRTRSLADRRVIARYEFALLNRRHIVAATELQPGMIPGRTVL